MTEAGIDHLVIDAMFHCSCGTALLIIDKNQTERCDICGKIWKVDVRLIDVGDEDE